MKKWSNIKELQSWLNDCDCIADFCKKLEIKAAGDNYRIVKELIKNLKLDTSHFKGNEKYKTKNLSKIKDLSEVLEDGKYTNATKLKDRLFRWGVKEKKCECCGLSEWMGIELALEIHHIDGNHSNNHLENLQILCPNCHSLTNNYRGKNIIHQKVNIKPELVQETIKKLKEKEKEEKERVYQNKTKYGNIPKTNQKKIEKEIKYCLICGKELDYRNEKYCSPECAAKGQQKNEYDPEKLIEQSKTVQSMIQLAKLYNITDNALKKRLKKLGIFEQCQQNFLPISKAIIQYDLKGNFIKEWQSARDASILLNIPKCNILGCCIGNKKTTHGYIFKYKD